jgi:hypothetical protein
MARILSLLAPLAACAMLGATPASAAVRDWRIGGFDKVDLAAAASVQVHAGPGFSVRAEGDQRLLDRLDIYLRQGTLVIGWKKGSEPMRIRNDEGIRVSVTMPRVTGAMVSGAGTVFIDRADAPTFAAKVGGAGTLRVASLRTGQASLDVGGAGTLEATGSADRVSAHVTGVGSIKAGALAGRAGLIDLSGTGSITARINGPVEVKLSGLGSVNVLGNPRCVIRKSGWGSVNCGKSA